MQEDYESDILDDSPNDVPYEYDDHSDDDLKEVKPKQSKSPFDNDDSLKELRDPDAPVCVMGEYPLPFSESKLTETKEIKLTEEELAQQELERQELDGLCSSPFYNKEDVELLKTDIEFRRVMLKAFLSELALPTEIKQSEYFLQFQKTDSWRELVIRYVKFPETIFDIKTTLLEHFETFKLRQDTPKPELQPIQQANIPLQEISIPVSCNDQDAGDLQTPKDDLSAKETSLPGSSDDLNTRMLQFFEAHKFSNYTAYQLKDLDDNWKNVANVIKKLLNSQQVIEKTILKKEKQVTIYKYCPEYYTLHDPNKSKLDVMCRLIKNMLLENPDMSSKEIRTKVQDYLLGTDRVLVGDALFIMQETKFITWTSGVRGTKCFRVNDACDIREAAIIRDKLLKSDRFIKYKI